MLDDDSISRDMLIFSLLVIVEPTVKILCVGK